MRKFPREDARRIHDVMMTLKDTPYAGDITKLKGAEDAWRRRVGAYRFFFEVVKEDRSISIYHVERRTSTTY